MKHKADEYNCKNCSLVCAYIIVHKCCTQHRTQQFR